MAMIFSRNGKRGGFTLITSLAFSLVVGTVLAGVGTVALSHLGRSKVEGTYANAISLAEAGVNYEIQKISSDTTNTSLADQMGSPAVIQVNSLNGMTDVRGQFSVYVRPWGTGCNGNGTWLPPNDLCIVSEGTIDGISRTIQVRGVRKSIFDEYALYAYKQGTFSGSGSASGSTHVEGNLGTNGELTFNGTLGTNTVVSPHEVVFNGGDAELADSDDDKGNTVYNPDPVIMPDVSQMAALQFPGSPAGLTWLASNNNNAAIRKLSSGDTAWAAEPTVAGITLADVQALPSAGFTAASRTFEDPPNTVPSDSSTLDLATSGTRFVQVADSAHSIGPYGVSGKRLYLVPPGDYYFHNIDFKSGNSGLVLLTHLGQIRIWIDQPSSGAVKADNISIPVIFTDTTPSNFRLFYNKCETLTITGGGRFNGGFYAINDTCTKKDTPEMKFTGNSMIYGSVITDYFTTSGGSWIVFPNFGGSDPTDFSLWFGFKDNWKELPVDHANNPGDPVFADGTAN
jgi:hypothetical protein